jgi:guanylate kinase
MIVVLTKLGRRLSLWFLINFFSRHTVQGVLTLKNTYLEPRYVLLLPLTRESHERRLIEKDVYSESQVNTIVNRTEMYAEYNRQHPGFFDATITCGM